MEDQKDCLVKQFINNSSLNKKCLRLQILRELLEQVKDKNVSSYMIKPLLVSLSQTLYLYNDGISLCLVRDILKELCAIEKTNVVLIDILHGVSLSFMCCESPSMAKLAYTGISWTCVISQITASFVETQANFLSCIVLSGILKLLNKTTRQLWKYWKNNDHFVINTVKALLETTPSPSLLPLLNLAAKYCYENDLQKEWTNFQSTVYSFYCKTVFSCRTYIPEPLVLCCSDLFKGLVHEQFSSILLSSSVKCLLRNPDELIPAVSSLFMCINLDCSRYALEYTRTMSSQLHSTNNNTRAASVVFVTRLVHQCSDTEVCVNICQVLLDILLGKSTSGKLVNVEHRQNVLLAISCMSQCPLMAQGLNALSTTAVEGLLSYLKQEAHGGTQVTLVNTMCSFCGYFSSQVPKSLVAYLKSVLGGKAVSPPMKLACWFCVDRLCQGENKTLIKDFIPLIHQSIDRIKVGGVVQNTMLEEGVALSWLLVSRACDDQDSIGTSISKIAPILDSDMFLAPKFLFSADSETLHSLTKVSQVVLVSPPQGLAITSPQDWVAVLVHIALNCDWPLQESALKCLSSSVEVSEELSFGVLNILEESIQKNDIQSEKSAKALFRVLLSVSVVISEEMKIKFLQKSFLICHHPLLVSLCRNGPWQSIMKSLSLSVAMLTALLPDFSQCLLDNVASLFESCSNGLLTLVRLCGKDIVIELIQLLANVLKRDDILRVSATDVGIAATPPNRLWNSQLRQLLLDSLVGDHSSNIKRETKAYSYADQVWDVKIKQQINQKKLSLIDERDVKDLIKESKLTQKQADTITQELQLEHAIRESVNKFKQLVMDVHDIFKTLLNSGSIVLPYLPILIGPILNGIKSILTKELCMNMWEEVCLAVIQDRKIALLFSWTTLRLLSPSVFVPLQWSTNNLSSCITELIPLLSTGEGIVPDLTWSCALPMVQSILIDKVMAMGDCVTLTLQVFSKACQSHTMLQSFGHDIFPIAGSLELLASVISSKATPLRNLKAKKLAIDGFRSLIDAVKEMECIPSDICHQLIVCLSDSDDLMRQTALRGIETLSDNITNPDASLVAALLISCYDSNSENSVLAKKLWQKAGYSKGSPDLFQPLFFLLTNPPDGYYKLLSSTASALGQWLEDNKHETVTLYEKLSAVYKTKSKPPLPSVDSFGRAITTDYKDPWEGRVGVAKGLAELLPYQCPDECTEMFQLIVPMALADVNSEVREAMKETALAAIAQHGEVLSSELMTHFDDCLNSIDDTKQGDIVRQAIVVLMGSLAKHMESTDPKVGVVTELLLANLDTPSQSVQVSIANCLVPLAPSVKGNAESLISKLLDKLFNSTVYSQRRGAAYGLAGLIKGLGIPSLKQYNITAQLQTAINDKKNYKQREGALFAFQALCDMLGKLFEPYVVHLLPDLLLCFGDGNQYVREAAQLAARTIMTHLSAHGVKLVLPSLLTALEQDSWRTKAGSAELLGTMAYCAPKQLSSCLPSIVPRIMEVLTDSHSKVQQAGSQALKQIGSVIKSPEIQQLVPLLLEALGNPSAKAQVCLQALLDTEFEHKVDAPSLALIMPTVKRALELRSADSKKAAARVIGVLYSVTDVKDLAPYLNDVLPGLKQSLTDPLPEVRSSSAKALGSMVHGVGNDGLKEVWPWLLRTLQSEETPVDRSGAAQGIAQVLKAQGVEQLHQLMPRFVQSAQDPKGSTHSHDGYLMLMIYLPQVFGKEFLPFIDRVLPPILKGLADESEYVRDTALLAGQTIINNYADQSVDLFLPQLEKGLVDNNWRIRCSSVQLLGDLLFCISGQSGKMSTESAEDDNFATEEANQSIVTALGVDKRNKVLAGLYMGRSDVALLVRQNALHVWKLIVTNTAKTLRDILPTLISLLLSCLASDNYDKRQVAAQTLGDLVRKLGERVLPEIFPMLEKGLKSSSTQEREGVCIGLSEIIRETSREYMQVYASSLLPMIRTSLCDKEKEVRIGAAKTFDSLHSAVGHHVLEQVITPLLQQLGKAEGEKREIVLDGLQQVMTVKSNVVLPMIIPNLTQPPVNVRALSLLSSVAGQALYKHLPRVIPALVTSLQNTNEAEENFESAVAVVLSVSGEPGLSILIEELCKAGRHTKDTKRIASLGLLEALCSRSTADLTDHSAQLLIFATESLTDTNDGVCEKAWLMLEAIVTKMIPGKQLPEYTGFLYKGLKTCQTILKEKNIEELNGFKLKGITPLLTMLKEGLVSGSQDNKEESARCLILIIHMSSATTLTAGRVVMAIAGPLIRVLGDRYGVNVKVAVLETLVELVRKVGMAARAFIPQLQTSYLKSLIDVNQPVRNQAVIGIIELVELSPRVDPVFNEIHNGIKKNEDPALRNSLLQALSGVLHTAGSRMNDKYKSDIKDTLLQLQNTVHEGNRLMAADCLGVLCTCITDEQLVELMKSHLVNTSATTDWGMLQAKGTSLCSALKCVSDRIVSCDLTNDVENAIVYLATSDRVPLCLTGLECISSFINNLKLTPQSFLLALSDNLSNVSMDIRRATCETCGHIKEPSDDLLKALTGPLLIGTKDKNTAVKLASERALVDLLKLTSGDEKMKHCITVLDSATGRRLEECYSRVLCKLSRN